MSPAPNTDSLWLRTFHPSPGAPVRLICFPHAGGAASYFHPLSALLAPDVQVIAVQYPGRQDRRREPRLESIAALADAATDALAGAPGGDFAFFGHSMGAIIGFEVTRRLSERSAPGPVRLIASGRRAPSTVRDERVHLRDDAGLIAEMRRLGGTDPRLLPDDELLELALPQTRSDYKAIETYRCAPGTSVACPITVFSGTDDPHTTPDEVAAWAGHSTAEVDFARFPGGHFFTDSCRAQVAAAIRERLGASRVASRV